MTKAAQKHEWADFLKFFTEKFEGRPTRLGVFENGNDYWIESGLPLVGADIDTKDERPAVQLMLGDLTRNIEDVKAIEFKFTESGEEDGLDVTSANGRTTILRFEKMP
ncbi:MAG TPA: DUF5335 family protein [Pyrinomonadaceae bacterium]|nr:DUF5335 family protein [Pyrinomonadaceae bacterium]